MAHVVLRKTKHVGFNRSIIYCLSAFALGISSFSAAAQTSSSPPKGDFAALNKEFGFIESDKPMREMIKNWKKPTKIVVFVGDHPGRLEWLKEAAQGVKLVAVHNNKEALAEIADADAQLGGACDPKLVEAGKKLNWVQSMHGGLEVCINPKSPPRLLNGEVIVTSAKRVFGEMLADHAMAMVLTLNRGLDLYAKMNAQGHINEKREVGGIPPGRLGTLRGKTMLVVGLGGAGSEVARMSKAMGMRVIATRASRKTGPSYVDYVGLPNELPDLIGQADVVVATVPVTPQTIGMFNAKLFARMKQGAIFIPQSHTEVVVQNDLIAALKSGQIGAAGLDNPEGGGARLKPTDPLFNTPNVLITNHKGVHIDAADGVEIVPTDDEPIWQVARENLRRYVNGDKLISVVDHKTFY